MLEKVLVVMSGGLNSTTLAYDLQDQGYQISTVSFDYGQRHSDLELARATYHARGNGWQYDVVNLRDVGGRLKSALLIDGDVPEGHYAAESMKATIVPNRNAIMLSMACGIAVSRGVPYIATAVHGGDHFIYPDCRPEFIQSLSLAFACGNEEFDAILAPYLDKDKSYIAQKAVDLDYEWQSTYSCYKGGEKHCGRCGTCVERMEALWSCTFKDDVPLYKQSEEQKLIRLNWIFPESEYEDNTYWMTALEGAK